MSRHTPRSILATLAEEHRPAVLRGANRALEQDGHVVASVDSCPRAYHERGKPRGMNPQGFNVHARLLPGSAFLPLDGDPVLAPQSLSLDFVLQLFLRAVLGRLS